MKYFRSQKGIASVSIIFISLIIFTILASLLNLFRDNILRVYSYKDHYRANYISESILDLTIVEIEGLSHKAIKDYLLDLKSYKEEYLQQIHENPGSLYNPPNFSAYITQNLIPEIRKLGYSKSNPFAEYEEKHSYKVEIEYNSKEKLIHITATGVYNRARRFIKATLELPQVMDSGLDEYNLPKVSISPVNIVEYYQTFGE